VDSKIRVFITGISSELMQQFVASIGALDLEIIGLSRQQISIPNVEIIVGDLENPAPWEACLAGVDVVIHAAAITHAFKEATYFKINTECSKKLIDLSKKYGVKQFVFISSRTACPNSGGYGLSKLATEEYLKQNADNYLIIRPSEIFGGLKNEGIDQLIIDAKHKKIMACPVQIDYPLVPIFVGDVISLMRKYIFETPQKNKSITLNGKQTYTFYDIIKTTNRLSSNRTFILPIPKFLMYIVKNTFKVLGLQIGFVPDQVDRLYCPKETENLDFPFKTLEEYIGGK
jgi:nucleoside-diphosphate-sugar epimerase